MSIESLPNELMELIFKDLRHPLPLIQAYPPSSPVFKEYSEYWKQIHPSSFELNRELAKLTFPPLTEVSDRVIYILGLDFTIENYILKRILDKSIQNDNLEVFVAAINRMDNPNFVDIIEYSLTQNAVKIYLFLLSEYKNKFTDSTFKRGLLWGSNEIRKGIFNILNNDQRWEIAKFLIRNRDAEVLSLLLDLGLPLKYKHKSLLKFAFRNYAFTTIIDTLLAHGSKLEEVPLKNLIDDEYIEYLKNQKYRFSHEDFYNFILTKGVALHTIFELESFTDYELEIILYRLIEIKNTYDIKYMLSRINPSLSSKFKNILAKAGMKV